MKKILKPIILFFIILITGTLIITIINYFNILNNKLISIIKFLLPTTSIFISSYNLGKISDKLGYLEGLKLGSIIITTFILLTILLNKFNLKSILYYLILLLISIIGSMIGINKKKQNT